ncbi:extracellular solute-binding protein [Paenibacillaceae bacterium]|nr:extracellular solute-binding protein [Paenibacillaceae bacterium]
MRAKGIRKFVFGMLSVIMLLTLLSACSRNEGGADGENKVLRIGVLYGGEDSESYFRQQYTDMYEFNKNIEIQIVPAINQETMRYPQNGERNDMPNPYDEMKKLLTGDNPVDVVIFEYNMLRSLVQDNLLAELDPFITQDKFDVTDYVPAVIDGIKDAGDNKIFALTPTFTSSALFYNKKIFQDLQLSPPTDGMSWNDVMNLARQVASGEGDERKFGLQLNRWGGDGFWDTQTFAEPLQLRVFDDKGEKMLVNSDNWAKVWDTISGLYRDKIMPSQNDNQSMYKEDRPFNPYANDMFLAGRVAMMIGDYYYLGDLKRASNNQAGVEDFQMIDWDVVSHPFHDELPGVGGNVYLSALTGINAKAQNPKGAWDYVKFLNGKEWAKLKSRSVNEMVSRKEFLKEREGMSYNLPAFYSMKPTPPTTDVYSELYRSKPNIDEVRWMGQQFFQEVMEEKKTVKEALAEWETQGDAKLQEMESPESSGGEGTETTGEASPTVTESVY